MIKHLKYIGFRSKEKENKGFFNEKQNKNVDYKDFIKSIKNNKALKHPNSNKYHKLVFSLSKNELINSNRNMKDIIKDTIKRYEKDHNLKLNWIGSLHDNNEHPHIHVVIAGVSQKMPDSTHKRVVFKIADFKGLRQDFQLEVDRDKTYDLFRQNDKQYNTNMRTTSNLVEKTLKRIQHDIEKERQQDERNQQRERERER